MPAGPNNANGCGLTANNTDGGNGPNVAGRPAVNPRGGNGPNNTDGGAPPFTFLPLSVVTDANPCGTGLPEMRTLTMLELSALNKIGPFTAAQACAIKCGVVANFTVEGAGSHAVSGAMDDQEVPGRAIHGFEFVDDGDEPYITDLTFFVEVVAEETTGRFWMLVDADLLLNNLECAEASDPGNLTVLSLREPVSYNARKTLRLLGTDFLGYSRSDPNPTVNPYTLTLELLSLTPAP